MKTMAKGICWEIKALNQATNEATVLIYGDIGNSWWDDTSVDANSLVSTLANIPAAARLKVRINSAGGAVGDALAMVNALQRHPGGVDTFCDGIAASSAGLILCCGQTVTMAENSLFMIHAPWGDVVGNAENMRDYADLLDKFTEAMAKTYAQKSGKSQEDIVAMMQDGKDHWFTADEALAEGFCDTISNPIAIAAHASRFRPQANSQTNHSKGNATMPIQTTQTNPTTPPPDVQAIQAEALAQFEINEKQRREDIRTIYGKFMQQAGVRELLDVHLDNPKKTLEEARAALLDYLGKDAEPVNPQGGPTPRYAFGESEREKKIKAMGQVLMVKAGLEKRDPQNPMQSFNLIDMARETLSVRGMNIHGMDRLTLAKQALSLRPMGAAMTTSDFQVLLQDVMHKILLQAYRTTPSCYDKVCKIGDVSDFRRWRRLRMGLIGFIEDVNEAGEYKYGYVPDAVQESVQVKRRGKIIQVTPETIVNDDLGGLKDLSAQMGAAAKRTIDKLFFVSLTSNPVLADGLPFFHANHGNLAGTAAVPSEDSLLAAKNSMKQLKDPSGTDFIDVAPTTFMGPVGLDDDVNSIINAQYSTESNSAFMKPNRVRGLFSTIIGTPRLGGNGWYVFADPSYAPAWEVVFLDGQNEPIVLTEQDFDTSGIKYKVELPFGIAPIDPNGAYYNAGVAPSEPGA